MATESLAKKRKRPRGSNKSSRKRRKSDEIKWRRSNPALAVAGDRAVAVVPPPTPHPASEFSAKWSRFSSTTSGFTAPTSLNQILAPTRLPNFTFSKPVRRRRRRKNDATQLRSAKELSDVKGQNHSATHKSVALGTSPSRETPKTNIDSRCVGRTQLARPPVKVWIDNTRSSRVTKVVTEPVCLGSARLANAETGRHLDPAGGSISHTDCQLGRPDGSLKKVEENPHQPPGGRTARPSISNGLIRIKPVRGTRNVSLSDYCNTTNATTTAKMLDEISAAMYSDETDSGGESQEDGDRHLAENTTRTQASAATSLAYGQPASLAQDHVVPPEASPLPRSGEESLQQMKLAPSVARRQDPLSLANNAEKQDRDDVMIFSRCGATLSNARPPVRLEDVTPEDATERLTSSLEPEEAGRPSAPVRLSNQSIQITDSSRTKGPSSAPTNNSRDSLPQEGTSKKLPKPPTMFADSRTKTMASSRSDGGGLFGRGNHSKVCRRPPGLQTTGTVQSDTDWESDDIYDDIEELANSVLGISAMDAASIEKCKQSPNPNSSQGARYVLMMDSDRSSSTSNADTVVTYTTGHHSNTAGVDGGHEKRGSSADVEIATVRLQELEDTGQGGSPHDQPQQDQPEHDQMHCVEDESIQSHGPAVQAHLEVLVSQEPSSSLSSDPSGCRSESSHSFRRASSTPSGYCSPQVIIPKYCLSQTPSRNAKRRVTGISSPHFATAQPRKRTDRRMTIRDDNSHTQSAEDPDSSLSIAHGMHSSLRTRTRSVAQSRGRAEGMLVTGRLGRVAATPRTDVDANMRRTSERDDDSEDSMTTQVAHSHLGIYAPITPEADCAPKTPKSKAKSTGNISEHFIESRVDKCNTTASSRSVLAGTSIVPVPSIDEKTFGIIQEEYWNQPFWLLVAVTLLNKTTGRAAIPVFRNIMDRYPTPQDLAEAKHEDVLGLIQNLGLQNNRTKTLLKVAETWIERPPLRGRLYRKRNYPNKGDGKAADIARVIETDMEICAGAIEIGHLYGCGVYAYDSWRIFCRDVLREVAEDYNGKNAQTEDFEPEWKRVVPGDKELRACLRWMWLREGWIWDAETGEKRRATDEEMKRAVRGEMAIGDPEEQRVATTAAGVDVSPTEHAKGSGDDNEIEETPTKKAAASNEESGLAEIIGEVDQDNEFEGADASVGYVSRKPRGSRIARAAVKSSGRRQTATRPAKIIRSIEGDEEAVSSRSRSAAGSVSKSSSRAGIQSDSRQSDEELTSDTLKKPARKWRHSLDDDEYAPPGSETRRRRRSTRSSA